MTVSKKIGCIVLVLLVILVAGDLLGVAACLLGPILKPRSWSAGAVYAVWFVLGVFAGVFQDCATQELFNPTTKGSAKRTERSQSGGMLGLCVSILMLCALSFLFYQTQWRRGVDSEDGYVPDSMSATMTFFISIAVTMCFGQWVFRDEPPLKKAK